VKRDYSSLIQRIKKNIVPFEIMSEYLKFERKGANYEGRCTFCGTKDVLIVYNPTKMIWSSHEKGIYVYGDIFTFIQYFENN
jgi:DNA primase